jgi:hypothetical protein
LEVVELAELRAQESASGQRIICLLLPPLLLILYTISSLNSSYLVYSQHSQNRKEELEQKPVLDSTARRTF